MKIAFFYFLILLSSFALPQNFFPLKVGNKYQFKENYSSITIGPGGFIFNFTKYNQQEISDDTIIAGRQYYQVSGNVSHSPFINSLFYGYDSLEQKLYVSIPNDDSMRLGVDFNVPIDSHYISYLRGVPQDFNSKGMFADVLLGDTIIAYAMATYQIDTRGSYYFSYYFTPLFGLYKFVVEFYGFEHSISEQVVYSAIVDTIVYDPIFLKINSIYPIIDRPLDTFPYVLSINYSSTCKSLIDSFYVLVEHRRNDTLVHSSRINPSINTPKTNIYFDNLNVGDKLNFKAKLSDSSIFNNISCFPDTGLITIKILPPILDVENESQQFNFKLNQNYPNPFNPTTTIGFGIPASLNPSEGGALVTLRVYDILGNEVKTLINKEMEAGYHSVDFDASGLPSGVYFYQLRAGSFVETRKMVLLR